jgi:hypothetical protein
MAKKALCQNKPGAAFVRQLRERLNGQIVELPDGRVQVSYDLRNERQLQDWVCLARKGAPEIREGGLTFGRIEPEETENQWDRDIRLSLVLDPDPAAALEIDLHVSMGTNEPWSCAAWILTRRHGPGPGVRFLEGVITDWSQEWRETRDDDYVFKKGHLRADFLRRFVGDEGSPEKMRWIAPTQDLPLAGSYHMRVVREQRKLRWEVNGQEIGEATLADDELCLTERLMFANYGKGTGAVFRDVVIRARVLGVDPSWHSRDRGES